MAYRANFSNYLFKYTMCTCFFSIRLITYNVVKKKSLLTRIIKIAMVIENKSNTLKMYFVLKKQQKQNLILH